MTKKELAIQLATIQSERGYFKGMGIERAAQCYLKGVREMRPYSKADLIKAIEAVSA